MNDLTHVSTKALWKVSYPLMISFISTFIMLFVDRLFLAKYSTEALNAASMAGTLSWSFILSWLTLGALTEVLVAQYNGAKRYQEMGRPIWQMIWFVIPAILFFSFSAFFLSDLIYPEKEDLYKRDYFVYLMPSGPFAFILSTISAFYIGQGKGQIIKWLSILGNLVNIILDPLLIFGIDGIIPSLGVKGAAIATTIGYACQALIIIPCFLSKKNRTLYRTNDWELRPSLLKQCLKIGFPPSIFSAFEILSWAIFYHMMSAISPSHIFVCSVSQSIEMLFLFFCLGLEKGVAAIMGNLIGAGKTSAVKDLVLSAFKLIGCFALFLLLTLVIYPDPLINLFIDSNSLASYSTIKVSLIFVALYLIGESIRWIYSGILTASGDTFFLMLSGTLSTWIFLLIPSYFLLSVWKKDVLWAFALWVFFSIGGSLINFARFKQGAWKTKRVLSAERELG